MKLIIRAEISNEKCQFTAQCYVLLCMLEKFEEFRKFVTTNLPYIFLKVEFFFTFHLLLKIENVFQNFQINIGFTLHRISWPFISKLLINVIISVNISYRLARSNRGEK